MKIPTGFPPCKNKISATHIKIHWPVLVKVEKRQIQNNNEMEKNLQPETPQLMLWTTGQALPTSKRSC